MYVCMYCVCMYVCLVNNKSVLMGLATVTKPDEIRSCCLATLELEASSLPVDWVVPILLCSDTEFSGKLQDNNS